MSEAFRLFVEDIRLEDSIIIVSPRTHLKTAGAARVGPNAAASQDDPRRRVVATRQSAPPGFLDGGPEVSVRVPGCHTQILLA